MRDLQPLFNPRSIGVIGVSRQKVGWGMSSVRRLIDYGYSGDLRVIGSQAEDLPVPNTPSLDELSDPLDLLVVAVPAEAAVSVVDKARRAGAARSFIVYPSGFAEADDAGQRLQESLVSAVGDLPLLGPNCLGIVNRTDGVYVSMSQYLSRPRLPRPGRVGIVTQSGALGFVLASQLERYGVSFSQYASVGNEAVLDAGTVGQYLASRDDVSVVGLYLEAVRNAESLAALATDAHRRGKRVVALKTGTTVASRRATLSHTAAVAGDPMMFDAFCRKWGIVQADSDESFADLLMALQRDVRLPDKPRFAVLTMSGGAGALAADRLASAGATMPEFDPEVSAAIRGLDMAGLAGHTNPVDLGGQFRASIDKLPTLLDTIAAGDEIDALAGYFTFGDELPDAYRDIAARLASLGKPAWMIWAAPPDDKPDDLPPGVVLHTVEQLARIVRGLATAPAADLPPAHAQEPRSSAAPTRGIVTEADAHRTLREAGVAYVDTVVCATPEQLPALLATLPSAPRYVVKVDSPDELHRVRAGLIRLNVVPHDLVETAEELWRRAASLKSARLVIQPQLDSIGEISVGVFRDPVFGLALIAGPGGARVEDPDAEREVLLMPAGQQTLTATATRAAATLTDGTADPEALATVLSAVQRVALAHDSLSSMDINPLLITADGQLVAVDSLLISGAAEAVPASA